MRVLLQRVSEARVSVEGAVTGAIGPGLLVLAGVTDQDTAEDRSWLARKIVQLRVFDDDAGVMNRSVQEVGGDVLVVSQFTLHASTRKGNRPSYAAAARPEIARPAIRSVRCRVIDAARKAGSDRRVRRDDAGRAGQ